MKIDLGKFKEKRIFAGFDVKDSDNDGVYDVFDCEPHNPRKHGIQPSQAMKERLSKLPIYFTSSSAEFIPGSSPRNTFYTLEKEKLTSSDYGGAEVVKKVPKEVKKAQVRFLSAIKKRPEIVGEIERTRPGAVIVTTKKSKSESREHGYAYPTGKIHAMGRQSGEGVIVVREIPEYEEERYGRNTDTPVQDVTATTFIHEAEHIKQFKRWKGKPKLAQRMKKGRYEKRPEEIKAVKASEKAERKRYYQQPSAEAFWRGYRRMTK